MLSEEDKSINQLANAEMAAVLADVDAATRDGFRDIDQAQLPSQLTSQTRDWRSQIFLPGAEGDAKNVRYAFHISKEPAANFVRMERVFRSFDIVEFHSPLVISVWVRPQGQRVRADTATVDEYTRIARSLFNLSSNWVPRPPSDAEQGLAVSTAPARAIYNMPAWSDRVDAGVHADHFHFMFYKRNPQFVGLGLRRPWFDDEFRRQHP